MKGLPLKCLRRSRSTGGLSSVHMEANHVLFTRMSMRISSEFSFSISDKDYYYFLGIYDETRLGEPVDLTYHVRRVSVVLTFSVVV